MLTHQYVRAFLTCLLSDKLRGAACEEGTQATVGIDHGKCIQLRSILILMVFTVH